jgi:hypothetical protein
MAEYPTALTTTRKSPRLAFITILLLIHVILTLAAAVCATQPYAVENPAQAAIAAVEGVVAMCGIMWCIVRFCWLM